MANYPRLTVRLVATTSVVAVLCTAAPAVAVESAIAAPAAITKAESSVIMRRDLRGTRIAATHFHRQISQVRRGLDCLGIWCGSQFVLILGVAY